MRIASLLAGATLIVASSAAMASETITYSFDGRGRLVQAARGTTGTVNNGLTTAYQFDRADNRTSKATTGSTNAAPGLPTEGVDRLQGGYGADVINALGGDDFILIDLGGNDVVDAGAGNDAIFAGAQFTAEDSVNGGAGTVDQIALQGNYPALTLAAGSLSNVETIALLTSQDYRFGGGSGDPAMLFSYKLTPANANVAAGATMTISGSQLLAGEVLNFNGAAETDGAFRIFGGAADDQLTGGSGADLIAGLEGSDRITPRGGADTIQVRTGDSNGAVYDILAGFDESADKIDLPGTVTGFASPVTQATISTATFEANLATAVQGALGAGQAVMVTVTAGTLAGKSFLVADGNNIAGFQAGADFVFQIDTPAVPISGSINFFI